MISQVPLAASGTTEIHCLWVIPSLGHHQGNIRCSWCVVPIGLSTTHIRVHGYCENLRSEPEDGGLYFQLILCVCVCVFPWLWKKIKRCVYFYKGGHMFVEYIRILLMMIWHEFLTPWRWETIPLTETTQNFPFLYFPGLETHCTIFSLGSTWATTPTQSHDHVRGKPQTTWCCVVQLRCSIGNIY